MQRSDRPGDQRAATLEGRFAEEYAAYQYAFVEFFVEHLSDLSRTFGGDLQQMMLLAVIGQRRLRAIRDAGGDPGAVTPRQTAISASRLADVTCIPRETVRRKLALLAQRGWIEQEAGGGWRIVPDAGGGDSPARRDLIEQDRRARRRVARLVAEMEAIVGEHED
jgi:hypothetical protein